MQKFKNIIASVVLTVIGSASVASAGLLAYDPFPYTSAITSATPAQGQGFTGNWDKSVGGTINILTPGLSEALVPASGNAVKPQSGARGLSTLATPVSSGIVYFSGIMQLNGDPGGVKNGFVVNGTGGALFVGNVAGFNGLSNFLGVTEIAGGVNFDNPPGGVFNGATPALNADDHLVVAKINLGTGQVDFYLDPAGGPSAVEPAIPNATTTVSIGTITSLGFQGDGVIPTLDEMRLADTFVDAVNATVVAAVPEPASLGLLGLGAIGLLARRRIA